MSSSYDEFINAVGLPESDAGEVYNTFSGVALPDMITLDLVTAVEEAAKIVLDAGLLDLQ